VLEAALAGVLSFAAAGAGGVLLDSLDDVLVDDEESVDGDDESVEVVPFDDDFDFPPRLSVL
jgi:hypothetical protein